MSTFPADIFAGKRFAVVGLGKNGLPAARGLHAMGAEVTAWDDKPEARAAAADLTLRDPSVGASAFDALVLSPGIPHRLPRPHPAAERATGAGVPILTDVELLYQAVRAAGSKARFAGITGTNGKSTTTALLAHILSTAGIPVAAGANLGPAALSLPLLPHHGVYVLEMSSYMLERLATLRFDAAAMLNLSADHLDRHGDMAAYALAKRGIFARQTDADHGKVVRGLPVEHRTLRPGVPCHVAVSIDVVGGEVQHNRRIEAHGRESLQHVGGHFQHVHSMVWQQRQR